MNPTPSLELPAPFKILELPSVIESLEPLKHQLRVEEWALRRDCIIAARHGLQRYLDGTFTHMKISEIARLIALSSELGRNVTGSAAETAQSAKDPLLTALYEKQLDEVFGKPIDVVSENVVPPVSPESTEGTPK
jgi:hypothetical protein